MNYKDLRKQVESLNNLKKECRDPIVCEMIEQALVILDKAISRMALPEWEVYE